MRFPPHDPKDCAPNGDSAEDPSRLLVLARLDQRQRWLAGERVPAEDYLSRYPTLLADEEAALVLILGEFLLRQELGDAPALAEYQRRFPTWAARLQVQADLHAGLESTEPSVTGPVRLLADCAEAGP